MRAHIRLAVEMLAALAVAWLFLRELGSRPLIESTRLWPAIVLFSILAVAGLLLASTLWRMLRAAAAGDGAMATAGGPLPAAEAWLYPGRRYALMAIFATYVLALPHLGYALATAVFIPAAGLILGMPPTVRNLALAVAMAAGIWLLFVVAFDVPMPEGLVPRPRRLF